jgi:hypothetical protein
MPRIPQPGDPDFDWSKYDEFKRGNDPLADAKRTLAGADQFADETGSAGIASIPERLASLSKKPDTRGIARRITEPLAKGGDVALMASLPAMINPAIGGALATGGGLATLPDYVRRIIAPEEDEQAPGYMETGMQGLAMLPAVGALRGLKGAMREVGPLSRGAALAESEASGIPQYAGRFQSKEIPYQLDRGSLKGLKTAAKVERAAPEVYAEAELSKPGSQAYLESQFAKNHQPRDPHILYGEDEAMKPRHLRKGATLVDAMKQEKRYLDAANSGEGSVPNFSQEAGPDTFAGKVRAEAARTRGQAKPDLFDEFQSSVDGPVKPFEMDGATYAADASGSHKAVPRSHRASRDMAPGQFQDQLFNSLGGEEVPVDLSPLDRLSRLSVSRAKARAIRSNSILPEGL